MSQCKDEAEQGNSMRTVRKLLKSSGLISNEVTDTEALLFADSPRIKEAYCKV